MLIEEYFQQIQSLASSYSFVHSESITYDKRATYIGFIKGAIYMVDGSVLHIREFVNAERELDRYMYAYHYQQSDSLVFRYDNAAHAQPKNLAPIVHHKHDGSESCIVPCEAPSLADVLDEIRALFAGGKPER
ncbi:MAG: DUF6516 family protein [Chloroflexota bacterium]